MCHNYLCFALEISKVYLIDHNQIFGKKSPLSAIVI